MLNLLMRAVRRWQNRRLPPLTFISIDTETTGLDPVHNSIVEIGWTVVVRGRVIRSIGCMVEQDGSEVWGTWPGVEDFKQRVIDGADGAMSIGQAVAALLRDADLMVFETGGAPRLVFHNAPFDLMFIAAAMAKVNKSMLPFVQETAGPFSRQVLDTQAMCQPLIRAGVIKSQGLARICKQLGVKPGSHTAASDSRATAELVLALFEQGWL